MTPLMLAPLEMVYASVVRARNARFDRRQADRLSWPVISIGNLSVGGAGKTPLVICLAQLLARESWLPDVLSRGYGRTGHTAARVDVTGTAAAFGDEPLLIARTTGVPVYVAARRYDAGLLAERTTPEKGRHVHLLDDGFQHRQLARDADIVVMHSSDVRQHLLPAGRLREPLSSLRRADVVVLRTEDVGIESALRAHVHAGCRFWKVRRALTLSQPVHHALAFCAIARPDEFFSALTAVGAVLTERIRFRDHHRYTAADIDRLTQTGKRAGCDAFVITAKDEVKLNPAMRQQLETVAPVVTASLTVEIEEQAEALATLSSLLRI